LPSVERSSVWTEQVKRGELVRQVPAQGALVPLHVQWLSAVSAARVAKIMVRPGAHVTADTVVLVLENAELELAALEAERQAASAESSLIQLDVRTQSDERGQDATLAGLKMDVRDAEQRAETAEKLAREGLLGSLDYAGAMNRQKGLAERLETETSKRGILVSGRKREVAAQQAELERLREIAKFRRKQLAALEVKAGIDGIVQDVPLENGQWVAIGTLLAKVAEPDHLKADVRVAEGYAKDVRKGLSVRFESPSGKFSGVIERVDPAVVGGNVRLEVLLDETRPMGARADQAVSGYVEIERLTDVLYVARPASAREESVANVFRIEADHVHATKVAARIGRGSAREVEILGGLAEGDEILVSDTSTLDSANRIKIK
jgi:multidrug efflux pump subunit AcrA (membrane-fusion protein)